MLAWRSAIMLRRGVGFKPCDASWPNCHRCGDLQRYGIRIDGDRYALFESEPDASFLARPLLGGRLRALLRRLAEGSVGRR